MQRIKIENEKLEYLKTVNLAEPESAWTWVMMIARHIQGWEPSKMPDIPAGLGSTTPERALGQNSEADIQNWSRYQADVLSAWRQNRNSLWTLLRCIQIVSEERSRPLKGRKSQTGKDMEEYFRGFLGELWGLSGGEIDAALTDIWGYSKDWSGKNTLEHIDQRWMESSYRVA